MRKLTQTKTKQLEDYVECVLNLEEKNGYARVTDIAEALELSKPSVSAMVRRHEKYFKVEDYRIIRLTALGREEALSSRHRHSVLKEFFELLHLNPSLASTDAEEIEHCISPEGLEKLALLTRYWQKHPAKLRHILDS
jgi:Mn-dependent DtxR family transcriptional regulator